MSMFKKYKKKPVEIDAVQFTDENKDQVFNDACVLQNNICPSFDDNGQPILIIPTLEGEMICAFGDYLIVEPFPTDWRKLYPCKPDIFKKTYEKVVPKHIQEAQLYILRCESDYGFMGSPKYREYKKTVEDYYNEEKND